jgi:hypothetical protein
LFTALLIVNQQAAETGSHEILRAQFVLHALRAGTTISNSKLAAIHDGHD